MGKKSQSVVEFESIFHKWEYSGSTLPEYARSVTKFDDKTANGLTKIIVAHGRVNGWCLNRINTTGMVRGKTQQVKDVLGFTRTIGSTTWTPSGSTNGVADITGSIGGRYVEIEVKVGRDRQRDDQKKHQQQVEQSGGIYFIVHSFDEYLEQLIKHQLWQSTEKRRSDC